MLGLRTQAQLAYRIVTILSHCPGSNRLSNRDRKAGNGSDDVRHTILFQDALRAPPGTGASVSLSACDTECERVVADVLAMMSLPEKAGQIVRRPFPAHADREAENLLLEDIAQGRVGTIDDIPSRAVADRLQAHAQERSRLGIPLLFPAIVGSGIDTIMPAPLSIASSWDLDAIAKGENVVAHEAAARGYNWIRGRAVDLVDAHRKVTAHHWTADPYLAGAVAAARIRGLQGTGPTEKTGVLATLDLSDIASPDPQEDALAMLRVAREPMHDSQVGAIDFGHYSSQRWETVAAAFAFYEGPGGHEGIFLSRWDELVLGEGQRGLGPARGGLSVHRIVAAIKEKQCDESALDDAVARVLRAKFKLGLLSAVHSGRPVPGNAEVPTPVHNRETALALACRCAILLRNEPALLPLGIGSGDLLIVGRAAAERHAPMGDQPGVAASVIDGFEQLGIPHRFIQGLALRQDAGPITRPIAADNMAIGMASQAAKRSGTVIFVHDGGRDSTISEADGMLLSALRAAATNLVVVTLGGVPIDPLVNGRPLDCLLHAGQLGTMSGHAVAALLSGEAAPSAKLPFALAKTATSLPHPFGYGMTYSRFALRDLSLEFGSDCVRLFAQLHNTGDLPGEETIQVYVTSREHASDGPVRERRSLVAFERKSLRAGERCTLDLSLGDEAFGAFMLDGTCRVMPGTYDVMVGLNAETGLRTAVEIDAALAQAMSSRGASERIARLRRA